MTFSPECFILQNKEHVSTKPIKGTRPISKDSIENQKIIDAKFKTFGCGSAIAASSLATEWVKDKSIDDALSLSNVEIVEELSLPPVKIHCSVLAEDAIKAAIEDYKQKNDIN